MLKNTEAVFIEHDFNLPNYENELKEVEQAIEKVKKRVKIMGIQRSITQKIYDDTFEHVLRILEYVGNLSKPAFEIEDELEEMYTMRYSHSPELGKKLWLDHYGKIHHPYNTLKNRCFTLMDTLEELLKKKNERFR